MSFSKQDRKNVEDPFRVSDLSPFHLRTTNRNLRPNTVRLHHRYPILSKQCPRTPLSQVNSSHTFTQERSSLGTDHPRSRLHQQQHNQIFNSCSLIYDNLLTNLVHKRWARTKPVSLRTSQAF